jgi:hypothetical protein
MNEVDSIGIKPSSPLNLVVCLLTMVERSPLSPGTNQTGKNDVFSCARSSTWRGAVLAGTKGYRRIRPKVLALSLSATRAQASASETIQPRLFAN